MLKYQLVSQHDTISTYKYYPKGEELCGTIEYDFETGHAHIIDNAPNDISNRYANKFICHAEASKGHMKTNGIIAWY